MPSNVAEKLGQWGGQVLAPLTGALSRARGARMFHPDGVLYRGVSTPLTVDAALTPLAQSLAGPVLLRFSSALWRRDREWPDVLGVAMRFLDAGSGRGEQDLLLATIRFPWTTPFAPLATNFHSFLWNHYHAVSPFKIPKAGAVKFRLRSPRLRNVSSLSRAQHLEQAVMQGHAQFELQLRRLADAPLSRSWVSLSRVVLEAAAEVDQEALRFSPFRAGRDLRPTGFVHALRLGAYRESQRARPSHEAGDGRATGSS